MTSIASGFLLQSLPARIGSFEAYWLGGATSRFHVVFGISLCLRLVAAVLARGVREPSSVSTRAVVMHLVGVTPLRIFRFPLGLRHVTEETDERHSTAPAAIPMTVPVPPPAPVPVKSAS
jgi:hypothetical protein